MTTKPKTRKAPDDIVSPAEACLFTNREDKAAKANRAAPKRRRAHALTEAEAAATDFEPWEGEVDTKKLPKKCGKRGREWGSA